MDAFKTGVTPESLADQLVRLTRERAARQRIQELCLAFSTGVSATLAIGTALDSLSRDANVLFGTTRVSVWLHQRRTHELVLAGSSDRAYAASAPRVSTDDPTAAPSRGLRLAGPLIMAGGKDGDDQVLVAPLRGWRRALGTFVVEGQPHGLDAGQLSTFVQELSRQLSVGIENIQLLEEVLRQRRLLENTFNSIVDLVVVTDNELRVVQMNEAFAARTRATRKELLERPLPDLVGAEMAEWVQAQGEGGRTRQITDRTLGGIFASTVTRLIDENGEPVGHVLVARDISEQATLEAEREALRGRLAQSERLASLGQFVAGIAHEMNNPLQGVLGHLELLIETSAQARPLHTELRRIYREGDRAAKIVRNLLVFAGSRRMDRHRLRIDRVIARALSSRSASLRRGGINVVRHIRPAVPAISGDALLLQQAFLNILINAEHAIGNRDGARQIDITVDTAAEGTIVRTIIRDTGPGIVDEVLPRIFDPFFTTKDVGKGTGLGLAITYGIIQEHGGLIIASNTADGGAAFTIDIPAAPRQKSSRAPAGARV
jgi:PAS domain S-box-containing protein